MSTWVQESKLRWYESLAVNVLKCGAIPNHVAFIMDGNRRFANKCGVQKIEGHSKGFDKLTETLRWCLALGITEVTVYAFSIENYRRSQEEVDQLMNLAREKFTRLLEETDKLNEHGVAIRVIGNIRLLPVDLQKLVIQSLEATKSNTKAVLNIGFSYTSREEMTNAINEVSWGLREELIAEEDVDEELVDRCLYTGRSPPPGLLIRTSGEVRLSDFLLWQTAFTTLYFTPVLWPEFSLWDLCKAIFHYQANLPVLTEIERATRLPSERERSSSIRVTKFLEEVDAKESRFRHQVLSQ